MQYENLLIEIGTEELPPKALKGLAEAFAANMQAELEKSDLAFESIEWHAAPRRLALSVKQLASQQQDKVVEKRGPAVNAAFDAEGNPTKAADGWARSNGITVEQAERLTTDKGEWLVFQANVEGQPLSVLLADLVSQSLAKLPIPKPMRWGSYTTQFIRPVHSITLLYGREVIPGTVLGLNASNIVFGHRFHGEKQFTLSHADNYLAELEAHYVIADFDKRRQAIKSGIEQQAATLNAVADIDSDLLDEVTALVEWPVVLTANFEASFLQVPKEALIYTMKGDQKYFPLLSVSGELLPTFAFVTNIESSDPIQIIKGNEKVIRPRLADAEFFFNTDKKQTLESRLESLGTVLFQKQLGTLKDKSERISALSGYIGKLLGADVALCQRAGLLSKTDLMSNMVMEFPDVQGIMGMHYARIDGENEAVAVALNEQYQPRFSGDVLPSQDVSRAVSLADKLDTLVGIFGIGQIPKGDKDPFALRRAAIGAIRILVEVESAIDLNDLVAESILLYGEKVSAENLQQSVVDFVLARFRNYYQEQGISVDIIQAVMALTPTQPADFAARIKAVSAFKALPEAESLAASNKRVANILAKNSTSQTTIVDTLLTDPNEIALASRLDALEVSTAALIEAREHEQVLTLLAAVKDDVDAFFDNVMVMADEEDVRNNRLALLGKLRTLFLYTADLSLLNG